MKKQFIYLRGQPGTGKITVARILEEELGWKVFWLHDLKNTVYDIVREHRIPRLMDEITAPILRYLLDKGDSIIFVRPSPDKETVEAVQKLLEQYPEYGVKVIRLEATRETLARRVAERNDPYRISTQADLDKYLSERSVAEVRGELTLQTDGLTPEQVASQVLSVVNNSENLT